MNAISVEKAIEAVYESMKNDNQDIDDKIRDLKTIMKSEGKREPCFNAERLVQNNREGRKRMQSYFKKRGVKVVFAG